ncbi:c-type cytochrome [Chitinophaga sancti]|uniref:Cytochrome c n=1 Tax=Chitinophaga sancti TaxID=1004 RepID=A0A1K1LP34_9BACT|nr:cytochrome c [Chitinophaga sancti]WQD64967.1 cytochrome c [Chitinophaga sancti]WQG89409.1 cytochrome c [Chitinophaga sancti]SFW12636.1 Planctomycete cytochrome C [Chitinophaga sancti]
MKRVFFFLSAIAIVYCLTLVTSCSKNNEKDLTNPGTDTTGTGGTTCDTVNMKYAANVQPILSANCYSCHGNGSASGGISLDTYAKVLTQVNNGNLVGVITHATGYPAMPQGGAKLSDCKINTIKDWIARGAQNN